MSYDLFWSIGLALVRTQLTANLRNLLSPATTWLKRRRYIRSCRFRRAVSARSWRRVPAKEPASYSPGARQKNSSWILSGSRKVIIAFAVYGGSLTPE